MSPLLWCQNKTIKIYKTEDITQVWQTKHSSKNPVYTTSTHLDTGEVSTMYVASKWINLTLFHVIPPGSGAARIHTHILTRKSSPEPLAPLSIFRCYQDHIYILWSCHWNGITPISPIKDQHKVSESQIYKYCNCQPRPLYLAKLSIKMEGDTNFLWSKQIKWIYDTGNWKLKRNKKGQLICRSHLLILCWTEHCWEHEAVWTSDSPDPLKHYVPIQPIFLTSEGNLCGHCSSELKIKSSAQWLFLHQVCHVNSVPLSLCLWERVTDLCEMLHGQLVWRHATVQDPEETVWCL